MLSNSQKTYKILWFMGVSYPRNPKIFKKLVESTGYENDVIVVGRHQKYFYNKLSIFSNVYDIMEDFSNSFRHVYEMDYKLIPPRVIKYIYKYAEYDRNLRSNSIEFVNQAIMHHYNFCNRIVSQNKYDYFYGEVGHLPTKLLVELGKEYDMKIIWPRMSFWDDRFFLSSGDEYAQQKEIERSYIEIKQNGITEIEKQFANNYLDSFRLELPTMPHMNNKTNLFYNTRKNRNYIIRKIKRNVERIQYHKYFSTSYYGHNIKDVLVEKVKTCIPKRFKYSRPHFEDYNLKEKYILYYLQSEPDLSTFVLAPYYKDQIHFVRNLAFSIPYGYRLYVKEHPLMQRKRPKGYYEDLSKIPQVRLIPPEIPTKILLSGCDCVVTVTGTIGWEALLMKKSVITFGNAFYNAFKGVVSLRNWEDLNDTIHKLINNNILYDDKQLVEFIVAIYRCTYPGDWYRFAMRGEDDNKNTENVIHSFLAKMNELCL